MSEFAELENLFQQKFAQVSGALGKNSRRQGWNYFLSKGLPNKKQEAWKYTSLKSLSQQDLLPSLQKTTLKGLQKTFKELSNSDFHQILVSDGEIFMKPSDVKALKEKVKISFSDKASAQFLKNSRQQTQVLRQDSLEGLNSAFSKALVISVKEKTTLEKPLQVLFYSRQAKAQYPRLNIHLKKQSELKLIETYLSDGQKHFTDAVSEISLDEQASLQYLRVQSENKKTTHFGCSRIYLKAQANLESLVYSTGSLVSRHNLDVHCLGEGANAIVNGLTLGNADQHFDNSTRIDHVVGHCTTNQLYKSLLAGKSKAVFRGQVEIRPQAQKAFSEQLNKNLLLSKEAEADSIPQLNIYADDVKATHGSTVGQMSEEEIFYLLSRAIDRDKAVEMLSLGFVKDLVDRVSNAETRTWLEKNLETSYRELQ